MSQPTKAKTCEQFYRKSEVLKKSFFANKLYMSILAAGSGALALLVAAKARQEVIAYDNFMARQEEIASAKKNCCVCCDDKVSALDESDTPIKPVLYEPKLAPIFRSGLDQHLVYSSALMAVPYVATKPAITACLLIVGSVLYCGSEYYSAFYRDPDCCREPMILGISTLLAAWITLLL